MRFGLLISAQYPVGDPIEKRALEPLEQVALARELGFTSAWAGFHYVGESLRFIHPIPLMSRLTQVPDIRLGVITVLPLHHPVMLAEELATLDVLSGGRLEAAFVLGYRQPEFDALGVPRSQRRSRYDEALAIIDRLWKGECVTSSGGHFELNGVRLTSLPVQKPRPPIHCGGTVSAAAKRSAELAEGWLVSLRTTLPTITEHARMFRQARQRGAPGTPSSLTVMRELVLRETRAEAWAVAERVLAEEYAVIAAWGHSSDLPASDSVEVGFAALVRDRFVIGNPEDCIGELRRYDAQARPDEMLVRLQYPGISQEQTLSSLRLFAKTVLPAFR